MVQYAGLGQGDEYELGADPDLVHDPKVKAWRQKLFVDMGFSMSEAQALARFREVDLHRVAEWIKNGCDHKTALEIALPRLEDPEPEQPRHVAEFDDPYAGVRVNPEDGA